MRNYAIGILLMGLYFFLSTSMTASSPPRATLTTEYPMSVDDIQPSSNPNSFPSSTQAKEYEKLERARKRAEIQKKIEAFLTQDHVKQIDSKFQQTEKT
jgi:hypothetical protein